MGRSEEEMSAVRGGYPHGKGNGSESEKLDQEYSKSQGAVEGAG